MYITIVPKLQYLNQVIKKKLFTFLDLGYNLESYFSKSRDDVSSTKSIK